ncbi:MAG: hypothetical protein IVW57_00025 [Ktedonobacterales bacterium]|nr:hypothetical protein [Ktedonobacterales bacterium]
MSSDMRTRPAYSDFTDAYTAWHVEAVRLVRHWLAESEPWWTEDLVQDIWLRLYQAWRGMTWANRAAQRAYILNAMHNRVRDYYRHRALPAAHTRSYSRDTALYALLEAEHASGTDADALDALSVAQETAATVRRVLDAYALANYRRPATRERNRRILTLWLAGLGPTEIVHELAALGYPASGVPGEGVNVSVVKMVTMRARARLAAALGVPLDDDNDRAAPRSTPAATRRKAA